MWFSVCLLFENVGSSRAASENLWEERIVLVQADSEEEAEQRAVESAKKAEHGHLAASGDRIECHFRCVERVYAIGVDQLVDGTEFFSRFLRESEVRSLLTRFADE